MSGNVTLEPRCRCGHIRLEHNAIGCWVAGCECFRFREPKSRRAVKK